MFFFFLKNEAYFSVSYSDCFFVIDNYLTQYLNIKLFEQNF